MPGKGDSGGGTCPNPMFIIWLEEWRDEADKRGLNAKWTYMKAISSIKKYPLPLRSGKECKILENIGDGIAKKLDDRLQQYLDNGGDPVLLHKIKKQTSKTQSTDKSRHKGAASTRNKYCDNSSTSSDSTITENSGRQYVCKYRSGAYALLMTLYNDKQDINSVGYMSKEDLQTKAQPLCDKSFTVGEGGSHYTAWSSMGTLVKKGYTVKRSNPAKYSITDAGCELARKLLEGSVGLDKNNPNNGSHSSKPLLERDSSSEDCDSNLVTDEVSSHSTADEEAALASGNLLARIRKNGYQVKSNNIALKNSVVRCDTGAQALESNSKATCTNETIGTVNSVTKISTTFTKKSTETSRATVGATAVTTSHKRSPEPLHCDDNTKSKSPRISSSVSEVVDEHLDLITKSSTSPSPLFTLQAGTFDVVLLVDTSETTGAGKHKKDLLATLFTNNVNVESRKLQLGDFLWVAKEKSGAGREVVLDTIVERKRMDDLAGSIVDGRFREQKFRLKNCGLKNPVYLVEKHGSLDHLPVPEATLRQAITNTQVIDNFFVKETSDIYDSANFITQLTSHLSSMYAKKTLVALPMDQVKQLKEWDHHSIVIRTDTQYLIPYDHFSTQTQKNKILTVREMFTKFLMQVKWLFPVREKGRSGKKTLVLKLFL